MRGKRQIPSGSQQELCRGLHAEQNVIIQAALHGVSTKGSILYCTHKPCSLCAKMIINAGISRIVYQNPYPDPLGDELVSEAGLEVCIFKVGVNRDIPSFNRGKLRGFPIPFIYSIDNEVLSKRTFLINPMETGKSIAHQNPV